MGRIINGSKNALTGLGYFPGGLLLSIAGCTGAIAILVATLAVVWVLSIFTLKKDLGAVKNKDHTPDGKARNQPDRRPDHIWCIVCC